MRSSAVTSPKLIDVILWAALRQLAKLDGAQILLAAALQTAAKL